MKLYGLFTCDTCGKQLGATCCTNKYQGQFCSVSCAQANEQVKQEAGFPTPPTPSQVLTGILDTLKEELSKGQEAISHRDILRAHNNKLIEENKVGLEALKQVESLRASVRILEKQKLVLKNEASRLYKKVRDLDNLCAEQIEYIEELERKVIQEDDNLSYIAQLHAILDKKDKDINELCKMLEVRKEEIKRLREEARKCPQTHKF